LANENTKNEKTGTFSKNKKYERGILKIEGDIPL